MKKKASENKESLQNGGKLSAWSSFWRFPIVWMLVGAIGIVLIDTLFRQLTERVGGAISLVLTLVMGLLAILVYKLTLTYLARRATPEIARQRAGIEALLGVLTGTIFIAGSVFIIMALGGYSFQWASSANAGSVLLSSIGAALGAAIVEELIFRGLMFQAIDRWGGETARTRCDLTILWSCPSWKYRNNIMERVRHSPGSRRSARCRLLVAPELVVCHGTAFCMECH